MKSEFLSLYDKNLGLFMIWWVFDDFYWSFIFYFLGFIKNDNYI